MDFYFRHGLAPSTHKVYASAQKRYLEFCSLHKLHPLPAAEQQVCQFVSYLANNNLCHSSIKTYLSSLRQLHIANSFPDPKIGDMPKLEQVLRGIKREQARKNPKRPQRLPITPEILRKIRWVWEKDEQNHDMIMLWAAVCLCFFGFMRSGEITLPSDSAYDPETHLSYEDITIDDPSAPTIMRVHLKASKTDPFRKGVDLFLGRANNDLCPLASMLSFLAVRGNNPGFLFTFEDGRLLTKFRFISAVRNALCEAGVNYQQYSGHSFRIGATTTAHLCGISDASIKMLGRWESSAYLLYVRTPRKELTRFTHQLASQVTLH